MADERVVADRYLLHEPVGRGGMGVVWRGEDQRLGRSVAVKEVHLQPGLDGEEREAVQQRVMREARAAAMLNHSGAVTVYDVAEDDGQAYIVMELVDAPTLADCVRTSGPLPPADAARVGLAVLDVLAAAHAAGIVHRDLKPANILLSGPDVKLTDFGIAQMKDDPRLTSTGIVLGSPSYIAPEQALGQDVTAATDIWGLGATLYFAATGKPPFDKGDAIATLGAVTHDELVLDPGCGALGPVLQAMLAKDPAERPPLADLRSRLAQVAESAASTLAMYVGTDPESTLAAPAPEETAPVPAVTEPAVAGAAVTEAAPVEPAYTPPYERPAPSPTPPPPVVRQRRRWAIVLLILLLAAGAGAFVAFQLGELPGITADDANRDGGRASGDDAVRVPAGWETYTHPTQGWTVAYPPGWRVVPRPDRADSTDFREPGNTGRYLRVGMTTTPGDDVAGRWKESSDAFGATHTGYEELRVEEVDYRDYDAALWEYTYRDGNVLHAYNLGFVTGGKGYALNFQTREGDWERSLPLFEQLKQAFKP
ncbi:MAG TPA: serine/threonine-protein kinase [Frankiaceae bacterium]|jgi:hypothetical protein|nr:serine/threonine-protein kinase [Frankiaceae bacterium]